MIIDREKSLPHSQLVFHNERLAVSNLQSQRTFLDTEAIQWALANGYVNPGQVTAAELAPSLRCPERCKQCPDSTEEVERRINLKLIPKIEPRTTPAVLRSRMDYLHSLGVRHYMFVGGTLDHLPEIGDLINY